jgi:ribose transport system ATP-binding protein
MDPGTAGSSGSAGVAAGHTGGAPPLALTGLSKSFLGQAALRDVNLTIDTQQVHALLGHNGSGKSTLIKILAGLHRPDAGSGPIEVDGHRLREGDPDASRKAGLRFIHQDLGLIDDLSVVENLALGAPSKTGFAWHLRRGEERVAAAEVLERHGVQVRPSALVGSLTAVQRTSLAVIRALQEPGARLVVFDEPTATLPDHEVDRLFELIRGTVAAGASVLYVSHRLEELDRIADVVTVLRDGEVVGAGPTPDFSRQRLAELIVGSAAGGDHSPRAGSTGPAADAGPAIERLALEGVTGGALREASLVVAAGEVVGLAGLAGSGVHDVGPLLAGQLPMRAGSVRLDGVAVARLSPRTLLDHGVALLPAETERKCIPSMTVRENLTLPDAGEFYRRGAFRYADERRTARDLVRQFRIRPGDAERPLATLSGGNRQKVCVAKWLHQRPSLLVLDEPTAGIDVGGRADLLGVIATAAEDGLAVLICSSDLDDLAELCSRVLVVREGRIAAELRDDLVTRESITHECYRSAA